MKLYEMHLSLLAGAFSLVIFSSCSESPLPPDPPDPPIISDTLEAYREIFIDPADCAACHPNHYEQWSQSMHAYAMTDPLFHALHEEAQESTSNQLDQFCVKCHSPFGSIFGETPPGFALEGLTEIASSGVNCDVCHSANHTGRGLSILDFRLDRVRKGPIQDPVENPYHESAFDVEISRSNTCAPCHDVKSPDLDVEFFIETTSTEWDESPYLAMGLECQDCHMPASSGFAAVGSPEREVHDHRMIGVDYPFVDFPGKDETILAVEQLLQNSVQLSVSVDPVVPADSAFAIQVEVNNNRTGHDVPSGNIIDRQMWLEVIVSDANSGDEIYRSGHLDENGDLMNHHSDVVDGNPALEDHDLALFNGTGFDENDEETLFFWEAKRVEKNTIRAFASVFSNYSVVAPSVPTTLNVSVRLRFRSFPPYLLRLLGQDQYLDELRIFEMSSDLQTISVSD